MSDWSACSQCGGLRQLGQPHWCPQSNGVSPLTYYQLGPHYCAKCSEQISPTEAQVVAAFHGSLEKYREVYRSLAQDPPPTGPTSEIGEPRSGCGESNAPSDIPCTEAPKELEARQQPAGGATIWTDNDDRDLYDYIVQLAELAPAERAQEATELAIKANALYIRIRAEAMWLRLDSEADKEPAGGAPLFDAFAILKENEWQGCDQAVCCAACGATRHKPPLVHGADCWLNEALTWLERAVELERARIAGGATITITVADGAASGCRPLEDGRVIAWTLHPDMRTAIRRAISDSAVQDIADNAVVTKGGKVTFTEIEHAGAGDANELWDVSATVIASAHTYVILNVSCHRRP